MLRAQSTTKDFYIRADSNSELQDLINRYVERATACGMEVSTKKNKLMTNSWNNISADITMNGQRLEEMTSFKYLGAILCKDGICRGDISNRIA